MTRCYHGETALVGEFLVFFYLNLGTESPAGKLVMPFHLATKHLLISTQKIFNTGFTCTNVLQTFFTPWKSESPDLLASVQQIVF